MLHATIQAGREGLVPVLMTALTSGIALVPLLIAGHEPGRKLLHPIATVMVGGLSSTTLLDLLPTPCVFLLFGRKAAERYVARGEVSDVERDRLADMLERQELIADRATQCRNRARRIWRRLV